MNYIISDIHGCFHTLDKLVEKVQKLDQKARLIFIGDYVDRGHYNKEVVDFAIKLKEQGAVCLRGNHDNVMDWILNDGHYLGHIEEYVRGKPDAEKVLSWWSLNGLNETLVSYGCKKHFEICQVAPYATPGPNWDLVRQEFVEKCPEEHKKFFYDLPIFWESDTHFACHAFFDPLKELPRSVKFISSEYDDDYLWKRFSPYHLHNKTVWDKIGVFGHTPVSYYGSMAPIKWDKIRLIDTGCFTGNYLCAYVCESDDWILQSIDQRDTLASHITQPVDLN